MKIKTMLKMLFCLAGFWGLLCPVLAFQNARFKTKAGYPLQFNLRRGGHVFSKRSLLDINEHSKKRVQQSLRLNWEGYIPHLYVGGYTGYSAS